MVKAEFETVSEEICRAALPVLVSVRLWVLDCPTTTVWKLKVEAERLSAAVVAGRVVAAFSTLAQPLNREASSSPKAIQACVRAEKES